MTISSTNRRAGPFVGNGVTTTFPFAFKVFDDTDLQVLLVNADGTSTTLTLDSDYSVALNGDQDTSPGGAITYPKTGAPMPSANALVAIGSLTALQPTALTNNGGFYPSVIEDALDRAVILIQQLNEAQSRALTLPVQTTGVSAELPVPQAGLGLGWSDDGTEIVNIDFNSEAAGSAGAAAASALAAAGSATDAATSAADASTSAQALDATVEKLKQGIVQFNVFDLGIADGTPPVTSIDLETGTVT